MRSGIFAIVFVTAAHGIVAAQPPATIAERREVEAAQVVGKIRAAVETRVTRNAPYSGEAVTEATQVLADGNRIARKTMTRVYRDTDGRTRRETVRVADGQVENVSITDPVAGVSYVLDPETRTAYRGASIVAVAGGRGGSNIVMPRVGPEGAAKVPAPSGAATTVTSEQGRREAETAARVGLSESSRQMSATLKAAQERAAGGEGQTTKEELGQQMIDGMMAIGTRTTTVIPAGAIGNEQPIRIVSEQWFAPDLELLVLTKHSDPRVGETTYRLGNVVRGEPDRSLFEVPADYTIKESGIRRPSVR